MLVGHVIELQPNRRQATLFAQAVGIARFAYSWALAQWQAQYKVGGTPNEAALRKQLLVQRFSLIGIEDLNVRGMMANHCLARSIADMGFYEFRRQLGYKAKWYACQVVPIGRFEPSSKKCSYCGEVKQDLSLLERIYKCNGCGLELDRDLNAALNIETLAVSSTVTACGEEGSGLVGSDQVKPASMKQEENSEPAHMQVL